MGGDCRIRLPPAASCLEVHSDALLAPKVVVLDETTVHLILARVYLKQDDCKK